MAIRVVHCRSIYLPSSALITKRGEPDAGNSTNGNNDAESKSGVMTYQQRAIVVRNPS